MTKKFNLADIAKRTEEISESDMKKISSGSEPGIQAIYTCKCASYLVLDNVDVAETIGTCQCGSIWVIFGLAFF
jgi:hypothetical protein